MYFVSGFVDNMSILENKVTKSNEDLLVLATGWKAFTEVLVVMRIECEVR